MWWWRARLTFLLQKDLFWKGWSKHQVVWLKITSCVCALPRSAFMCQIPPSHRQTKEFYVHTLSRGLVKAICMDARKLAPQLGHTGTNTPFAWTHSLSLLISQMCVLCDWRRKAVFPFFDSTHSSSSSPCSTSLVAVEPTHIINCLFYMSSYNLANNYFVAAGAVRQPVHSLS